MGSPYQSQSASNYNASPPPDDGSTVAANKITWASIKTKLADSIKTLADSINTQLRAALAVTPSTTSVNYTTLVGDHLTTIEVSGTTTISLGDSATMIAQSMGYTVTVYNKGANTVTVGVATATDTLAGRANGTVTLPPGAAMTFTEAQSGVGYDIVSAVGFAPVALTGAAGTNTATANAPANLIGLFNGLIVSFTPANTNTAATTLNITPSGGSALGAKNIFANGAALVAGELQANVPVLLEYDGTQMNILGGTQAKSTWTPVLTFGTPGDLAVTYGTRIGTYSKSGNIVFLNCTVVTSSFTWTTSAGNLQITGLPFASRTNAGETWQGGCVLGGYTKAGFTSAHAQVASNASLATFAVGGSAQTPIQLVAADVPSGGTVTIGFTLIYEATS